MTGLEIAGLSVAAAGILGQGGNMIATGKLNKKNRDWQEKQTERANLWTENMWAQEKDYNEQVWNKQKAYNERVWAMQNQYDSPAAQMERFRNAGLNPNLMYGQNNMGGTLDVSSMATTQAPAVKKAEFSPQRLPELNLADGIMAMNNFKAGMLQNNNLEISNELKRKEGAIMDAQLTGIDLSNMQKLFDYDFKSDMRQTSMDFKKQQVANVISQINQRMYNYDLDVKKLGLQEGHLNQFIKQSNQQINESVARTGSTVAGIGLINQKVRSEGANYQNTLLKNLTEEQKHSIGELQKRYMDQKTEQLERDMYIQFIKSVLGNLRK